MFSNMV